MAKSEPNRHQICRPDSKFNRTVVPGTVPWTFPNMSELGRLLVGCLVGLAVNAYNTLTFSV